MNTKWWQTWWRSKQRKIWSILGFHFLRQILNIQSLIASLQMTDFYCLGFFLKPFSNGKSSVKRRLQTEKSPPRARLRQNGSEMWPASPMLCFHRTPRGWGKLQINSGIIFKLIPHLVEKCMWQRNKQLHASEHIQWDPLTQQSGRGHPGLFILTNFHNLLCLHLQAFDSNRFQKRLGFPDLLFSIPLQ